MPKWPPQTHTTTTLSSYYFKLLFLCFHKQLLNNFYLLFRQTWKENINECLNIHNVNSSSGQLSVWCVMLMRQTGVLPQKPFNHRSEVCILLKGLRILFAFRANLCLPGQNCLLRLWKWISSKMGCYTCRNTTALELKGQSAAIVCRSL